MVEAVVLEMWLFACWEGVGPARYPSQCEAFPNTTGFELEHDGLARATAHGWRWPAVHSLRQGALWGCWGS